MSSSMSSAGRTVMDEGLGPYPINAEIRKNQDFSVTTPAHQEWREKGLTATLSVLQSKAGKIRDYSAEKLSMEEVQDFLGSWEMA